MELLGREYRMPRIRKNNDKRSQAIEHDSTKRNEQSDDATAASSARLLPGRGALQPPVIVAIVGRPNVGKSTLFNRLTGHRQALVTNKPGVTRDRLYGDVEWDGRNWIVVDTGGIVIGGDPLESLVTAQSRQAIAEADAIICLFDGCDGLTALDEEMVAILRTAPVPVHYAVNKSDSTAMSTADFNRFGINPIPISAEHGIGVDDLLDQVVKQWPQGVAVEAADESTALRVAIVGRPNVGKSTLLNCWAGEERVVAYDQPGTTMDVIDVLVRRGDDQVVLLDTAGIRRKARTTEVLEKFSIIKTLRAIERADAVVLVCDATSGITHQDRTLASEIYSRRRPLVIGLNKWDLVENDGVDRSDYIDGIKEQLGELNRLPITAMSARKGEGTQRLWNCTLRYGKAAGRRLSTSVLNQQLQTLQMRHHLPSFRGHVVKISYGTQTGIRPPRFSFFTNFPRAVPNSYRRYMIKALETALDAPGLPIVLQFLAKH